MRISTSVAFCVLTLALHACDSSSPASPPTGAAPDAAARPTSVVLDAAASPSTGAAPDAAARPTSVALDAAAMPPADAAPDAAGTFFPCDVEAAIIAKCQSCHTIPAVAGAPFPLLEYAHIQRDYEPGRKIWQSMKSAIEIDFMPLAGSRTGPLTPAEKTTLLNWLNASAPPASQRCPAGGS